MFRLLSILLALAGLLSSTSGCMEDDDDLEGASGVAPIELFFNVVDSQTGENLLTSADSARVLPMSVVFCGETYGYGGRGSSVSGADGKRGSWAQMDGVRAMVLEDGRKVLRFGAIRGDVSYDREQVVLNWADGSVDIVELTNSVAGGGESVVRSFRLNGEEVYTTVFVLKK